MNTYLTMPSERRRLMCDEAEARLGLRAASIEKDFWVCWTLRELFSEPTLGGHLTFKGGTSLSKAWHLISRFSEDIDIVIDRSLLGFSGEFDPGAATSGKQRERRLAELRVACQRVVSETVRPALHAGLVHHLPEGMTWQLTTDESDGQTLLFHYPSAFESPAYVRPVVKIEMGARSDIEPNASGVIRPHLADVYPTILPDSAFAVRTLAPERTFWEKAMLLHEELHRDPDSRPKAGLARHFYDLWCLIRGGVGERAISNRALFERVAAHRAIFFRKRVEAQSSLRPGLLRLIPPPAQMRLWAQDYRNMRGEMFFGEIPSFDEILSVVGDFEERFNRADSEIEPR